MFVRLTLIGLSVIELPTADTRKHNFLAVVLVVERWLFLNYMFVWSVFNKRFKRLRTRKNGCCRQVIVGSSVAY